MTRATWMNRREAQAFIGARKALFDAAARSNPFAHSVFQLHFLDQIATDAWRILALEAGEGEQAAVMLLYAEAAAPRQLRSLTNYYASLFSPIVCATTPAPAVVDRLVEALAGQRPRIATADFSPIAGDDPANRALLEALRRRGWYVRPYFCFGNWYLPCAGMGFEPYMRARDSRTYNTWSRKAKRFKLGAEGEARLQLVTDPADVDAAMDAYDRVYHKSWKQPEPYPTFVREWARLAAQQGWLRLGLAWHEQVPIAAQFWFVADGRAFIVKLAYDEDYGKWSAGTVLSAFLFKHALEVDRVGEIDYLTGDDAYKRHWMSERRERTGLLACNTRTPQGLLRAAYEWAAETRKRWAPPPAPAPAPAAAAVTDRSPEA